MWREVENSAEAEELCERLRNALLREFRFATVRSMREGGLDLTPGNGLWLLIQGSSSLESPFAT